jgi:hypothetical protein
MLVNDPLLNEMNISILSDKEIVWKDIWNKTEKIFEKDIKTYDSFKKYVRPDENLGALLKKKLDNLN